MFSKIFNTWLLIYFRLLFITSLPMMMFPPRLSFFYSALLYIISGVIILIIMPTTIKFGAYLNLTDSEFIEAFEKRNESNVTKK